MKLPFSQSQAPARPYQRTLLGFLLLVVAPLACNSSDFTGGSSSSKTGSNLNGTDNNAAAKGDQNGTDSNSRGGDGSAGGGADQAAGGTGSGADSGGGAANGSAATAASCATGCCVSAKVALVDCSSAGGQPAPSVNKGSFDVTTVTCDAPLAGYDTVVYYGPLAKSDIAALPDSVDKVVRNGGKVVAIPTPNRGLEMRNFYGFTIENNIEFLTTMSQAQVSVTNPNAMSTAFSKATYGSATISHIMQPQGFFTSGKSGFGNQSDWCSDLTVASADGGHKTGFHAFLGSGTGHPGLLVVTTLNLPAGATGGANFDFNEPFLAAHLSQKWNKAGGQQACGLTCAVQPGSTGGFVKPKGIGKPVIYLYPTKEQEVAVRLDFDGELVTTYPQYDNGLHGWRVRARPDGQMVDLHDNEEYSYIYWNGKSASFNPQLDRGFVVKGKDSRAFLQKSLRELGLSAREANDMIVYWLPYLERNPYNLINFAEESYTSIARLDITPKPDAVLRVFMVFKKLEQPIAVAPQKLKPFVRKGFTAVEWGGTEIDGDWHIVQ